jgi:hypothetical protein
MPSRSLENSSCKFILVVRGVATLVPLHREQEGNETARICTPFHALFRVQMQIARDALELEMSEKPLFLEAFAGAAGQD